MSCGCKRKIEIEDKYGVDEEENIFQKSVRNILKILLNVSQCILQIQILNLL